MIVFVGELSWYCRVVEDGVVVVLRVVEVVTEIVLERDGRRPGISGAEFVVDSLGVAFVDVGVVPEGKGGVLWYDIRRLRVVGTGGWKTFV